MTLAVVWLLTIPGLLLAGGVALIWIGYRLLIPEEIADGADAQRAAASGLTPAGPPEPARGPFRRR